MAMAATQEKLWFLDALARIRVSRTEGTGLVSVIEMAAPPGAMPPLHVHDEDATFYVLDGRATFYAGDAGVEVTAGDAFVAPKDVPHTYRVGESGARWLVVTSPGRFEDFVRCVSRPAEGPGLPPPVDGQPSADEAVAFTEIAAENGIEILGPPGMLPTGVG